jgi:hypothetical protein
VTVGGPIVKVGTSFTAAIHAEHVSRVRCCVHSHVSDCLRPVSADVQLPAELERDQREGWAERTRMMPMQSYAIRRLCLTECTAWNFTVYRCSASMMS